MDFLCGRSLKLYTLRSFIATRKDNDEVPVSDFKKAYGREEVQIRIFLNLELDGGKVSALISGRFILTAKHGSLCIRGWVGNYLKDR